MPQAHERAGDATRGATRLAFDAVAEVTRIVEGMHANIAATPLPLGEGTDGRTRGITRLVYQSIGLIQRATGRGVDHALSLLGRPSLAHARLPQPQWDIALSALNGVLGDHLLAQENPLAIPMQLRRDGRPLASGAGATGKKLLLLVHGLCMSDHQWRRDGHDHGAALARESGHTPLYLFYNSGRHISENGRELAALLEAHFAASPTPIEEIAILAHSMGGLVARSACHLAAKEGHRWRRHLRRIVFLGTPHHGAPLERLGSWVQGLAELSPYVSPLARLGMLRSAGITDLRHGNLLDEDWQRRNRFARGDDARQPLPLPEDVASYAIAGTLMTRAERAPGLDLLGDGLVPLDSALGRHEDPARTLAFSDDHQWVGAGVGHLDLLDRPEVYEVLRGWLSD